MEIVACYFQQCLTLMFVFNGFFGSLIKWINNVLNIQHHGIEKKQEVNQSFICYSQNGTNAKK